MARLIAKGRLANKSSEVINPHTAMLRHRPMRSERALSVASLAIVVNVAGRCLRSCRQEFLTFYLVKRLAVGTGTFICGKQASVRNGIEVHFGQSFLPGPPRIPIAASPLWPSWVPSRSAVELGQFLLSNHPAFRPSGASELGVGRQLRKLPQACLCHFHDAFSFSFVFAIKGIVNLAGTPSLSLPVS